MKSGSPTFQFFVVTRNRDLTHDLQRVSISKQLQDDLTQLFGEQAQEFLGTDIVTREFTPTFTPLDGEVVAITPFPLPSHLSRSLSSPQEFHDLQMPFTDSAPVVKAIVAVDTVKEHFYFQYFDRSRMLKRDKTAIFKGGMFHRLDDPGITIDNHLAAVIADGSLYFRSFHRVNQFIDLKECFREATDSDILEVFSHEKLKVDDPEGLLASLSSRMRKRFSIVIASGILDHEKATPERIQSRAKKFDGLEIQLSGASGSRRIVFPSDAKTMGLFLRFLAEELYVSEITEQAREANSSRALTV